MILKALPAPATGVNDRDVEAVIVASTMKLLDQPLQMAKIDWSYAGIDSRDWE